MTHAESIAIVPLKSSWNEGIIIDDGGKGLCYVCELYSPPGESGIGLAESRRASAWSSFCLFLCTQQENNKIPGWRHACWYLSASISSTKHNSSDNTNRLESGNLSHSFKRSTEFSFLPKCEECVPLWCSTICYWSDRGRFGYLCIMHKEWAVNRKYV